MKLTSSARLTKNARSRRVVALVEELKAFECEVELVRSPRWCLRIDVPEELYSWITSGGLATLLAQYDDAIAWVPNFKETHDVPQRASLPALKPAPRARPVQRR